MPMNLRLFVTIVRSCIFSAYGRASHSNSSEFAPQLGEGDFAVTANAFPKYRVQSSH